MKQIRPLRLAIIPMLLAGCGGGGGDGSEPTEFTCRPAYTNTIRCEQTGGNPPPDSPPVPGNPGTPPPPIGTPITPPPEPEPPSDTPPSGGSTPPAPAPEPEPEPIPTPEPAPEPPPTGGGSNSGGDYVRSKVDLQDDYSSPQVKVLYVTPRLDAGDRQYDMDGTLDQAIDTITYWFFTKTGAVINFDTHQGETDIQHVTLDYNDVYYGAYGDRKHQEIESELERRGILEDSNKKYLVFYEGGHPNHCGIAPGIVNGQAVSDMALMYLRSTCFYGFANGTMGNFEYVAVHETLHLFGAEHTDDPTDIMYRGALSAGVDYSVRQETYINSQYVSIQP